LLTLKHVKYFVSAYEQKSFTKTAEVLNVVQPSVSMQIKALEEYCGKKLFNRTANGIEPTPLADKLYDIGLRILSEAARAEDLLSARRAHGKLAITIGIPPSLVINGFSHLFDRMSDRLNEIRLTVREGYGSTLIDWLVAGEIDLAITGSVPNENRLRFVPIRTERLVLVSAPAMALPDRMDCAAAVRLRIIVPSLHNPLRMTIEEALAAKDIRLDPTMEIDSLQATLRMVEGGVCAAILPESAFDRGATFVQTVLEKPSMTRTLSVAYLPGANRQNSIKHLITEIVGALG